MINTTRNNLLNYLLVFLVIFCTAFSAVPNIAYAESGNKFDSTNVLDDLKSSTVNGQPFDLKKYPFDENKVAQVVNFVEYCYSFKSNMQSNYGLYIYVYNPQGTNISANSRSNKIQMAVSYDADGAPSDYVKFDLQFCNKSEESNYKNLFYKFKVVDKAINGKTFAKRVNSNERRYDVSGIELLTYGSPNATEYSCGGSYLFTGYAAGYGSDTTAKSTLASTVRALETISLDVRSTNYRTVSSSSGKDHQSQLDSVYFSVDNAILEKYGKLQKVKAEWYEYKTAPIIVMSDKGIYDTLNGYLGVNNGEYSDALRYRLGYGRNVVSSLGTTIINYDWTYNVKCYSNVGLATTVVDSKEKCSLLPYLFYTGGSSVNAYNIPSLTLKNFIYSYDKSHDKGYLPIKNGQLSADLFAEEVDNGRTKGYNCIEIDASEKYDLLSYASNHGFWDKVGDYGFWATVFGKVPTEDNVFGIEPIYAVKDKDVSYDNNGIAKNLLLGDSEVEDFKDYYNAAKKADKTTFLFRYAVTDYFAGSVDIDDKQSASGQLIKDTAYMAKETVFMDFDVLQLTFNRDGAYHVIPVVSSPIDIVGTITPPMEFASKDWWKLALGIILLIILLIILAPILPIVFRGIWWVISLPFKAISAAFKGIGKIGKKPKSVKRKKKKNVAKETKDDELFLEDIELWEDLE